MTKLVKLGNLTLAVQKREIAAAVVTTIVPTHHVVSVDISGSMYGALSELRRHLKNKLASLVGPQDTVSLIGFSGRSQCYLIADSCPINNGGDLQALHTAIDRFLQPTGLTGFQAPLEMTTAVIDRIKSRTPGGNFNMFFLSDGYENQSPEKDVLAACQTVASRIDTAAVIEYGYYANRPLLTKMAELLGGALVFAQDFQSYEVAINAALGGKSAKKISLPLDYEASQGYAFAILNDQIVSFVAENGAIAIPESVTEVAYFTKAEGGSDYMFKTPKGPTDIQSHVFASLIPLAQRMKTNDVFQVLGALGDVSLVQGFASCFSKEDYNLFLAEVLGTVLDKSKRYVLGYSATAVPKDDAYTVLHMLDALTESEDNLFYPYHEAFAYERTTAARDAKEGTATFKVDDKSKGYPINGIVFNETRANVNIRVRVAGTVTLPGDHPAELPDTVPSFIYRAYNIVKDGIVHTRQLPVSLSKETFMKLKAEGIIAKSKRFKAGEIIVLDFPKLPVINRQMVKEVTAKDTFALAVELANLKGSQKVFNDYRKKIAPKESVKSQMLYGEAAVEYLKSVGVTDFNGFNPSSTKGEVTDHYIAKELKIAVKGLSSLPKVEDVETAIASGKSLKIGQFVMKDALVKLDAFMGSDIYTKAADKNALIETWIVGEQQAAVARTRELIVKMAQRKFAIIVGQVWFSDFASLDEDTLEVDLPGFGKVSVTASLNETEIEI
jgi:Mg-chelatase subunit ChlD